jgi:hypothetical protein
MMGNKYKGVKRTQNHVPSSAFFVQIWAESGSDNTEWTPRDKGRIAKDVETAFLFYNEEMQKARRLTLVDGVRRKVEMGQILVCAFVEARDGNDHPMVSDMTKRLLVAEIDNEEKGGANPATLNSALSSVQCGYAVGEDFNKVQVEGQLNWLIEMFGEDTILESFITPSDYKRLK